MTTDELKLQRQLTEDMRGELAKGVGNALRKFRKHTQANVHPDIMMHMQQVSNLLESMKKLEQFFDQELWKQGVVLR